MVQRAAAIYVAFFLVISAGAYAVIGTAQQPTVSVENPDYELSTNQTFDVDGRTYTVDSVSGGSAEASWVNESAGYTQTWDNNSSVTLQNNQSYRVLIPNESDPSSFTLREEQSVDRETVTQNGTEYVVMEDGENRTLVPVSEFLPEPETRQYSEGETIQFQGNETTFANVSTDSVELQWTAQRTNTVSFAEGGTADLNGQQYVAHFPDGSTLQLSSDADAYRQQQQEITTFNDRIAGLWGVILLSVLAAVFLIVLGFLPAKS